jgi:hypothetical protein
VSCHNNRAAASATAPPNTTQRSDVLPPDLTLELEHTKVLSEHTAKSYADERERVKTLDTKTGLFFSATGAVIGLLAGTLTKLPDPIAKLAQDPLLYGRYSAAYLGLVWLTLLVFLGAELCFLWAVRPRTFGSVMAEDWLQPRVTGLPLSQLHLYLAVGYVEARRVSLNASKAKDRWLKWGTWFLVAGLLVLVMGIVPLVSWVSVNHPVSPTQLTS